MLPGGFSAHIGRRGRNQPQFVHAAFLAAGPFDRHALRQDDELRVLHWFPASVVDEREPGGMRRFQVPQRQRRGPPVRRHRCFISAVVKHLRRHYFRCLRAGNTREGREGGYGCKSNGFGSLRIEVLLIVGMSRASRLRKIPRLQNAVCIAPLLSSLMGKEGLSTAMQCPRAG